jgi:Holliday junction resolvase RusA-like endonuclease
MQPLTRPQEGKKFEVTIPGRPVPKVRMTQKSKWSPQAKRSLAYQEHVGIMARQKYPQLCIVDVAWLAVWVYLKPSPKDKTLPAGDRADWSNYLKAIEDGLQRGGIIANDKLFIRFDGGVMVDTDERVEIEFGVLSKGGDAA